MSEPCNVTLTAERDAVWLVCDIHGTLRNVSGKGLMDATREERLHVLVADNAERLAAVVDASEPA